MAVLVVYDISDDHVRMWVARKLELMGLVRLQRSVWVHVSGGYEVALRLVRRLSRARLGEGDSIHVFVVPEWSYKRALSLGAYKPPQPPPPGFWEAPN